MKCDGTRRIAAAGKDSRHFIINTHRHYDACININTKKKGVQFQRARARKLAVHARLNRSNISSLYHACAKHINSQQTVYCKFIYIGNKK